MPSNHTLIEDFLQPALDIANIERRHLHKVSQFYEAVRLTYQPKVVVDLCCGNGLLGWYAALRDDVEVHQIDVKQSRRFRDLAKYLANVRDVNFTILDIYGEFDLPENGFLMATHACGGLSKRVVELAEGSRLPYAIMPCCQEKGQATLHHVDTYQMRESYISQRITPKNRVICGMPGEENEVKF